MLQQQINKCTFIICMKLQCMELNIIAIIINFFIYYAEMVKTRAGFGTYLPKYICCSNFWWRYVSAAHFLYHTRIYTVFNKKTAKCSITSFSSISLFHYAL